MRHRRPGNAHSPGRSARLRRSASAGLALLAAAGVAHGQRAYCNLTEVTLERLTNAVVLNFVSDGLLQAEGEWRQYVDPTRGWEPLEITRIPLMFPNARLRTSSFINVSLYPVSHVELAPAPWATQGVGVQATIVLYRPGRVANLEFTHWDENFSEGRARRGITYDLHLDKGRKTLVAVITSDRNVVREPNLRRAERLAAGPSRLVVEGNADAVDVCAVNVELRQLLAELGAVTGLRFAVDGEVERVVNLTVTRTPVDDLLAALVPAYGLSVRNADGVHLITEASGERLNVYEQTQAEVVRLNYLDPDEAIHLLPESVLPYLRVDPDHHALAVSGPGWFVDKVRSDLAEVDVEPELVEVELRVVEMRATDFDRVGLQTKYRAGTSEWEADSGAGVLSFKAVGSLETDAELQFQALERAGRAQTRAHLRKVVLSGQEGELFAGQVKYLSVLRPGWRGMDAVVLPVNVGVQVAARPVTGGAGGPIWLWLEAKVSSLSGEDPDTRMPEVAARTVRTEMRVDDGDTVVLATSVMEQEDRNRRSSGILSRLPLADSLYRSRQDQAERTELFLCLTARTVTDRPGIDLTALKRELRRQQDGFSTPLQPGAPSATAASPETRPRP